MPSRTNVVGANLAVRPPPGSAFQCETPPMMPKLPMLACVCGRRGLGKGVATVSLIHHLGVIDRIFYAGPAADSNSVLLQQLKGKLSKEDIYTDLNVDLISDVITKVEAERDDLVRYREEMKRYSKAKSKVHSDAPLFSLREDDLLSFGQGPPTHRWNGRAPCLLLWLDDFLASALTVGRGAKELASLCFRHRHVGAFKDKTPSLGLSIVFNVQAFRTGVGGVPKAVRANLTLLLLFKTRSADELKAVAQEVAHYADEETLIKVCEAAWIDRHDFLFVDFEPKHNHPTPFRRNFAEWIKT